MAARTKNYPYILKTQLSSKSIALEATSQSAPSIHDPQILIRNSKGKNKYHKYCTSLAGSEQSKNSSIHQYSNRNKSRLGYITVISLLKSHKSRKNY